jgi:peroxiredoxin
MKKKIMFIAPMLLLLLSCDNGTAQADSKSNNLSEKIVPQSKVKKDNKNNSKNSILAPDFTLADLKGQKISLSDLRGKVVLLNFWGTWCGPCKREIPDFVSLSKKHKKNGLEIIGVTLSSGSPDKIKDFSEKWNINYTLLTDINGNETQSVTARYGQATSQPITGIPTTFIIDRDGYIRQRYVGPRSEEVFYNDLEPYL